MADFRSQSGRAPKPFEGSTKGVELDADYFRLAEKAIPRLAALYPDFTGGQFEMEAGRDSVPRPDANQLDFVLAEESSAYSSEKRRGMADAL